VTVRSTFAFSILALGCGGHPLVPALPDANDGFTEADEALRGMDEDPPQAFALQPGDVVTLRMVSLETNEVEGLSVDERGMLHVPLAGDVQVAGMPLTQAENEIEESMRRFDRTVRITIIMSDPRGQSASVIGAVVTQGRLPIVPGMRLADLLAAAGGPVNVEEGGIATPVADLRSARLIRNGQALPVSLALAVRGDPRHNVRVRPGDHLYIPPQMGSLISVLGEVNGARVFPHQEGIRLSQALAMAGGLTRDANGGDIHIVRGLSTNPRVYRAAIDHVVVGHIPDPVLAPGDVVYVGSSALADFRDVMAAISPFLSIGSTAGGLAIGLAVQSGGAP
jgi:polysaccharide biosynthesis/export protein